MCIDTGGWCEVGIQLGRLESRSAVSRCIFIRYDMINDNLTCN